MQVGKAITMKRAIREFSETPLSEADIHEILNAGRRAQSSKNTQPWTFLAIRKKELLMGLSKLGTYAGHIAGANLAVAILTPDPDQRWSILFDAGQAAAYMQLRAWEKGIGSCLATIYEGDAARKLLGFSEELYLHVVISFGYPAEEEMLHRNPKAGGRRPFEDVVRFNRWAQEDTLPG